MTPADVPDEIVAHYAEFDEGSRLAAGSGLLERARTEILLARWLPPAPAVVYDVGGGPGTYSEWLGRRGYETHLVDPAPNHVDRARAGAGEWLASATVGEARSLAAADDSVDAVLLLGPLYHLTERSARLEALREARRVLRPGGVAVAAAISRFASLLDGLWSGFVADPAFRAILDRDLVDGQHRNTVDNTTYFTTAFLHRPAELAGEVEDAGFAAVEVVAVEGPGWLLPDLEASWAEPEQRGRLLELIERIEAEPALMGMSSHLLARGTSA